MTKRACLVLCLLASAAQAKTKTDQTIAFPPPADQTFGVPPFAVTATASSGLAVKVTSQTTAVCSVSGDIVTLRGAGMCVLHASQAGNASYNAAPSIDRSFAVAAASATVTLGGLARTYNGKQQSATCATSPGGLKKEVAYSDLGAGIDRIDAGAYGVTCTVTQAGYDGSAAGTLTIAKAKQTISFGAVAAKTDGDPAFALTAHTSSGLPVSFASLTPDVCTVSAGIVSLAGAGKCAIAASQGGNADYEAAADVDRSFRVDAKVTLGELNQVYDGTQKSAVCETLPAGLKTTITYKNVGSGTGRVNVGSYGVTCAAVVASHTDRATGTLTIAPVPAPTLHYVEAYDSALQGDWNITLWEDPDHPVAADPAGPAPGRTGNAIDVQFSPNGWGAFGLANMADWNDIHYMYLNEFKTIEFDIYFEPDSTGLENLHVVLEDAGYSSQPPLVNYLAGWDPENPSAIVGQWIHVSIDLTQIGATIPRFERFLFWNANGPNSQPHFHMANVRLGWMDDTTPAVITLTSATPSLTYDQLALAFTTDTATTYQVEYGIGDYGTTVQGAPDDWAQTHTAVLTGLSRGNTYQYRITAWNHHTDPAAPPTPGVFTGSYAMPAVPTTPPVISAFVATPPSIPVGASSTLTWTATDYDTLTIDQGVGSIAQIPGATGVFVSPKVTTTYTITAANAIGTVTSSLVVTTHPVPTITSFAATPATVGSGGTSTLVWNVDSFDTVTIDHGVGDVSALSGATGVGVSPGDTTTYVLTASNAYGTVRQTATVTIASTPTHPVWVMGYYVGYQSGLQPPDQVDYSKMTHIMVGAALPHTDGTFDTSFYIDPVNGPAWAKDVVTRAHAAGTKAILMLGGAGAVDGFRATSDPAVRAAFASNLKAFVDANGFDGIDMDWEPLDPNVDHDSFVALMQALQAPGVMPRSSYVYTLPTGWNNANFNDMANPFYGEVATYVDRISTMSYGMVWYGQGWSSWHSSALFGETPSTPSSIDNTVQALRAAGVPDEKIGIGVGFYSTPYENGVWSGGNFVHENPPDIPSYVTGPHQSTDFAGNRYNDNQASFSNVMQYLFAQSAYQWDDVAKVPYLSFATPAIVNIPGQVSDLETTYVTYDNEQSIAEKGSYVRKNNLGGVIIWTISQGSLADWKTTGDVDPLMTAISAAFRDQ